MNALARQVNPLLRDVLRGLSYYWTVRQAEYATDVMFRSREDLAAIYPQLTRHAIEHFHSPDVLRFLGVSCPGNYQGRRVESSLKRRPEGVRVRHQMQENWLKMYDKHGRVLRVEMTINNPVRFRVYRRNGKGVLRWLKLRKGTVDMRRRVEISRAINHRYLQALASIPEGRPAAAILDRVAQPVFQGKQRFRALQPVAPQEARALQIFLRGDGLLHGFRNRDLRSLLFPDDPPEIPGQSGRITRLLRLLRAHHIVHKLPGTSRYLLTRPGIAVCSTALQLRNCDVHKLPMVA
jgi:hypothetical protein